ncbi:hypothetical protein Syun_013610 [Stephania yunnanensis]|uniref:Uncharacterized protein n=1 Tax=Stephania yunnanensis TaxID=152371 RepID=A0AAP0JJT2_9MAGN
MPSVEAPQVVEYRERETTREIKEEDRPMHGPLHIGEDDNNNNNNNNNCDLLETYINLKDKRAGQSICYLGMMTSS